MFLLSLPALLELPGSLWEGFASALEKASKSLWRWVSSLRPGHLNLKASCHSHPPWGCGGWLGFWPVCLGAAFLQMETAGHTTLSEFSKLPLPGLATMGQRIVDRRKQIFMSVTLLFFCPPECNHNEYRSLRLECYLCPFMICQVRLVMWGTMGGWGQADSHIVVLFP